MLHLDIHIISTKNPDMKPIRTYHTPVGVVYLGLIGQFHYQAFEKIVHCLILGVTNDHNF